MMAMTDRTCIIWSGGTRNVLRDDEIDEMFAIGQRADSHAEAWDDLEDWLEARDG